MDQSTSSQATDLSHKPSWLGQSHVQLLGHAVYILAGIASSSSVLDLILLSCAMRIYLRTGSWKPFNHICHLCVILCAHKRVRPTVAERSAQKRQRCQRCPQPQVYPEALQGRRHPDVPCAGGPDPLQDERALRGWAGNGGRFSGILVVFNEAMRGT